MGSEPTLFVTDQDPSMRVAFPRVFKEAKHRFCMSHIMPKVGDKVGPSLSRNESFRAKLNIRKQFSKKTKKWTKIENLLKQNITPSVPFYLSYLLFIGQTKYSFFAYFL